MIDLREIRRKIGDIEIRGNDGYRVRAEALVILLNAENAQRADADELTCTGETSHGCPLNGDHVGCKHAAHNSGAQS